MSRSAIVSQPLRVWMDVFMHRSMRGWGQFAKSSGLSMPQFSILMQLHYKGACGMSQVSERFDISAAAASQLVEKLVQGGLIERVEDPNDRRAKLLSLSKKGGQLVERGIQERYRWMENLTASFSADEQKKIASALEMLTEAAHHLEDKK